MSWKAMRFEQLLEAVPDALVGVDEAGVIRFVNGQTESMFGYDRGDLVGQTLEMLVPESLRADHAAHRASYSAVPTTRPMSTGLTLTGLRRDGTHILVDINLSSLDSGEGRFVIAAVRGVTTLRDAESDRARAERLMAIVDYSDDAIIGTSLDDIVTSWNPAAERIFGYSSGEMLGRSVESLAPVGLSGELTVIRESTLTGRQVDHFESTTRVGKDGTVLTVSIGTSPVRDVDGAIVGFSLIVRDVSMAKQAFGAARSMMEAILDSLVAISPEGQITDANEATVRLTGVPRSQLIGTSFSGYFTDPKKAEAIYQRVLSEGSVADYQMTLRHKDGRETLTDVVCNASVYHDSGGNPLGVYAAARDVTKQLQAQREAAEQRAREQDRLAELEQFQRLTVGRELKMIELKKEIGYLRRSDPTQGPDADHG